LNKNQNKDNLILSEIEVTEFD